MISARAVADNHASGVMGIESETNAGLFRNLFFDSIDGQFVGGVIILNINGDYVAGNELATQACEMIFPTCGDAYSSCERTARLIKENYLLGLSQFNISNFTHDCIFDICVFPKYFGMSNKINCFLCTIEKRGMIQESKKSKDLSALLTRRQVEIVELVAGGLSDKEIADQLYLSEHTVHKHLENVRRKLGVSNRVAILKKLNLI